jgi:hypothetical protein
MPRRAKATELETKTTEVAAPRGTKTQAIKDALKANRGKAPKDIAELLRAQGLDVSNAAVSMVKFQMKGKKKKAKAAPAPEAEATRALPKDAVSIALLQKAKKLAAQLGGIKQAKTAIDALAQLVD